MVRTASAAVTGIGRWIRVPAPLSASTWLGGRTSLLREAREQRHNLGVGVVAVAPVLHHIHDRRDVFEGYVMWSSGPNGGVSTPSAKRATTAAQAFSYWLESYGLAPTR
jgi:hypothetical protein